MPELSTQSARPAALAELADSLPNVELEVRHGGRSTAYFVSHVDFLIGTVPGCDLRVPGADLPPVLCLLARRPGGLSLRKLAPTQLLLVNGQTVSHADLGDNDRVTLGAMDIFVRVQKPPVVETPNQAQDTSSQDFENQLAQFRLEVARFQEEREAFATRQQQQERPEGVQTTDLEAQRLELATMRQELVDMRRQHYERYQERRDRLAGLQTAVDRAAHKVQERKRQIDMEEQQARQRRHEDATRRSELDKRAMVLEEQARRLEEERRLFEGSHGSIEAELEVKLAELRRREETMAGERRDLDARLQQYKADLVRLDRLHGTLDEREKKLLDQSRDYDAKLTQLQNDSADLEEQVVQLDAWRISLQQQSDELAGQKAEHETLAATLAQRSAAVEGQQATLAALRTRLERTREEVRAQEQQIDQERASQESAQTELDSQRQALHQLQVQLEGEQQLRDQERQQLAQRGAVLEAAVSQLRQAQEKLGEQEKTVQQRTEDLDGRAAVVLDQEGTVGGRLQQLTEAQERLDHERQALRERTQALTQTELARESLQEQLRRRSEELAIRQKTLDDKLRACDTQVEGFEARKAEIQREVDEAQSQLDARRQEQAAQVEIVQTLQEALARREAHHREQFEQLQNLGRNIAGERKALADERAATRQEQESWLETQAQNQATLETMRQEAIGLARQLPDVELRAGTALERLTHAREQLRDHLAELHAYVQECRDDLENARGRLQQEEVRLEEQEQALRRSQEEHRLAMVAFRQQMIGWQGQIVDLKRLLAKDETRLERRQAQVEEQAKEVGAASEKLAQKVEALQHEQDEVAGKRQDMDRHLVDMREWYRHKLRELAGIDAATSTEESEPTLEDVVPLPMAQGGEDPQAADRRADAAEDRRADAAPLAMVGEEGDEDALIPTGRNILSLTEPVDAGDRKLGELLTDLELIDRAALNALLVEARRQRRSLRQVLLASGVVTLYQLAIIEAGNVAGLMLGPVRVVDRLRVTAHETVYRVYDPRRGCEAVLRHLAEEEMLDAVHPDEYRQRFTQAMIVNPHVAATLEVLDINGRPAVVEEWLSGLPSSDWPPLAAAPGVCFRLFTQAALALDTIHKAGLAYGNLGEGSIFLTSEGVLKIHGVGEPAWLRSASPVNDNAEPRTDLHALGEIVSGWCTPAGVRRGPKTKPLPEALVAILYRLAADAATGYASAAELLEDLDRAGSDVPPNAEAWERLLRYVREHATAEAVVRRSA